jgi:hypothetical protein
MVFGHVLALGVAIVLTFFMGQLLYLWQFASLSWIWVAIGLMLVLFVRAIPLATDLWSKALDSEDGNDVMNVIMAGMMMLGIVLFIVGAIYYRDKVNQLDLLDSNTAVFTTSDPVGTVEHRLGLEDERNRGLGAAVIGLAAVLATFGALMRLVILPRATASEDEEAPARSHMDWLLSTFISLGVVAFLLALL